MNFQMKYAEIGHMRYLEILRYLIWVRYVFQGELPSFELGNRPSNSTEVMHFTCHVAGGMLWWDPRPGMP